MKFGSKGPTGPQRHPVSKIPTSKNWVIVLCILQALLVVPYCSNALPWAYGQGHFPIRPALYLLFVGSLNFLWVIGKSPDWTKTSLLVVLLLVLRAVDAAVLQRFTYPDGHSTAVFGLFAAVFMAVILFTSAGVMHRTSYLPALVTSASTIVICVVSLIAEWLGFFDFTIVDGRFSGFAGDPNRACVVMNLMLGIFLVLNKRFWPNMGMIALTAIGVFPTLSRGGLMILTLIAISYIVLNFHRHPGKILLAAAAAVPAILIGVGLLAAKGAANGKKDSNVEERIGAIFGGEVSGLQSNDRMKDLTDGLEAVSSAPVTGLGTGAGTNLYQPHNQIISLWIDLGLIGPAIYCTILALLCWKTISSQLRSIYLTIPLVLYFPLSQALVENHAYFYAFAIALVVSSRSFLSVRLAQPAQQIWQSRSLSNRV
tara:strand:+ start:4901 stop:6181 length:1281 start_codon:yes stop_codon:yes gene_type:complete